MVSNGNHWASLSNAVKCCDFRDLAFQLQEANCLSWPRNSQRVLWVVCCHMLSYNYRITVCMKHLLSPAPKTIKNMHRGSCSAKNVQVHTCSMKCLHIHHNVYSPLGWHVGVVLNSFARKWPLRRLRRTLRVSCATTVPFEFLVEHIFVPRFDARFRVFP